MVNKKISLLIGSGFSIPDKIPGVAQLNQRLRSIRHDEIAIESNLKCYFLPKGEKAQKGNYFERLFIQQFLEFYTSQITHGKNFNYEDFFDYYSVHRRNEGSSEIDTFISSFQEKHQAPESDWLFHFDRNFNQLIASQLFKKGHFNDISYSGHQLYNSFVEFLSQVSDDYRVDIHSLNHDTLLEFLGNQQSSLFSKFSDGFTLNGSPVYGTVLVDFNAVHKEYKVRLPVYNGIYDTPISLYKLHGSITTHVLFNHKLQYTGDSIRIKNDFGVCEYHVEIMKEGKPFMDKALDKIEPEFLTGTTEKMLQYDKNQHIHRLFKIFEKNLKKRNH